MLAPEHFSRVKNDQKWEVMGENVPRCVKLCVLCQEMAERPSERSWPLPRGNQSPELSVANHRSRSEHVRDSGLITWYVTRRDNVLFDSPEVADLHRGSQRCWSPKLYLRSRDAESEKRRVRAMLPDSSARVPCGWRRPGLRRLFSSSIQQPGGAPGVATGKVRWEALFSLFIVAMIVFCSPHPITN